MTVATLTPKADGFPSNVYLIDGARPTLVDTGQFTGLVEAVEDRVPSLDAVVLTHQDSDHVGQLDAVVEAFDPAVYAHAPNPRRTHTLADGDEIRMGDAVYEAVYTPGHATDHVAFVGSGRLFSGDIVVYNDAAFTGGSFGRTDRPGDSRDRLIRSLEELLDRMPDTVEAMYPGHGDSYRGDVRAVVQRALERAKRRDPKYPPE